MRLSLQGVERTRQRAVALPRHEETRELATFIIRPQRRGEKESDRRATIRASVGNHEVNYIMNTLDVTYRASHHIADTSTARMAEHHASIRGILGYDVKYTKPSGRASIASKARRTIYAIRHEVTARAKAAPANEVGKAIWFKEVHRRQDDPEAVVPKEHVDRSGRVKR